MKNDKPIAIVAATTNKGFDWARDNLEIREINRAYRRIIDITGQHYYIVTLPEHVRGMEFSDLVEANGFIDSELLIDVRARVK